jgi:hypothetical protein
MVLCHVPWQISFRFIVLVNYKTSTMFVVKKIKRHQLCLLLNESKDINYVFFARQIMKHQLHLVVE